MLSLVSGEFFSRVFALGQQDSDRYRGVNSVLLKRPRGNFRKKNGGVQLGGSLPFLENHSTWWWIIVIQRFSHIFTVKMAASFISCWRRCLKSHRGRETLLTPMALSCKIKNFFRRVAFKWLFYTYFPSWYRGRFKAFFVTEEPGKSFLPLLWQGQGHKEWHCDGWSGSRSFSIGNRVFSFSVFNWCYHGSNEMKFT